jgi:AcrR family transcriptional regulator
MRQAEVIDIRQERKAARSAEKKRELALHALSSLAELGYARTNLRDVAQRSGASLGVIHYYFENKAELIACSIVLYKEGFAREVREVIAAHAMPQELASALAAFMEQTVIEQPGLHRLWYDVRAQAQFEPAFQACVQEVEQALQGIFDALFARLEAMQVPLSDADPLRLYIILDGWFRHFLQQHLAGDTGAAAALRAQVLAEFARLIQR